MREIFTKHESRNTGHYTDEIKRNAIRTVVISVIPRTTTSRIANGCSHDLFLHFVSTGNVLFLLTYMQIMLIYFYGERIYRLSTAAV